eukprot:6199496-Pleurochrysis_carterae.AAC.2
MHPKLQGRRWRGTIQVRRRSGLMGCMRRRGEERASVQLVKTRSTRLGKANCARTKPRSQQRHARALEFAGRGAHSRHHGRRARLIKTIRAALRVATGKRAVQIQALRSVDSTSAQSGVGSRVYLIANGMGLPRSSDVMDMSEVAVRMTPAAKQNMKPMILWV